MESLRMILETGEVEYTYEQREKHLDDNKLTLIQKSLERLDTKELRIREAYESGIDTLDEFKANEARLQRERDQLMEELEELRSQEKPEDVPGKEVLIERIRNVYDLLQSPDVDNDDKGNAVRSIIKKIVYIKESKTFCFYYYV